MGYQSCDSVLIFFFAQSFVREHMEEGINVDVARGTPGASTGTWQWRTTAFPRVQYVKNPTTALWYIENAQPKVLVCSCEGRLAPSRLTLNHVPSKSKNSHMQRISLQCCTFCTVLYVVCESAWFGIIRILLSCTLEARSWHLDAVRGLSLLCSAH